MGAALTCSHLPTPHSCTPSISAATSALDLQQQRKGRGGGVAGGPRRLGAVRAGWDGDGAEYGVVRRRRVRVYMRVGLRPGRNHRPFWRPLLLLLPPHS